MRRLLYLVTAYVIFTTTCFAVNPVFISSSSFAQTPQTTQQPVAGRQGQALEIAPPVINLSAKRGQTIKTRIFLRNITRANIVVTGEANDFLAEGENGAPKVILEEDINNPYSLKDWIQTPASLLLVPREIKTMEITIRVPSNASPGGHYGVIRFTARAPSLNSTGVALSASLGSLVLLAVDGKINENLTLEEFSVNKDGKSGSLFQSTPLNFVERIKNNGNVHEQPTGQVTIKDMFGKKTAAVNVNLPPRNILPSSIRRFEQPLDKAVIGDKKLFGRYTAEVNLKYGQNNNLVLTGKLTFWVIPLKMIALIIGALVAGFFAIRYLIRRYNRFIIGKSNKPKRK